MTDRKKPMELVKTIFWNKKEGRLRAAYRIILLLIALTLVFVPFRLVMPRPESVSDASFQYVLARAVFGFVAVLLIVWLVARLIDKRRMSNLGLQLDKHWWIEFLFGSMLGIVLMVSIFFAEYSLGWVTISQTVFSKGIAWPAILNIVVFLALFISVGFVEELFYRGYLITNLSEGLNLKFIGPNAAILVSWVLISILFGVGHMGNPAATTVAGINIAATGIFLGAGYVLTGRLALPIGVHITWNFFQGNVFGFPVSGVSTSENSKIVAIIQGGPDLWTGGVFGPEAGLIGICATITGLVLTVVWVRLREGRLVLHIPLAETPNMSIGHASEVVES